MRWPAERGAPTNIGTRRAPAGSLDLTPMTAPPTPKARVARRAAGSKGGNQTIDAGDAEPAGRNARATSDATNPTQATRRYCMTATSRMSPPKASDISTMAVAAPADDPQTAGGPGSTLVRVRT